MSRTFKLTIAYDGTDFIGWQRQATGTSIQGLLEEALSELDARPVTVTGAGRTDAGVHALAQVAHLDIETSLAPEKLRELLNEALPSDIAVLSAERVPRRFHARHDATGRSYLYQVSRRKTAFAKPFVWWVKAPLAINRMREAAGAFVGFHDFRSFSDDDPSEKSTEVALETLDIHEHDDLIVFHVQGSHFIWKMVRRLVGVLVAVGRGDLDASDAAALLKQRSDLPARLTAPASGLFLETVHYGRTGTRRRSGFRTPGSRFVVRTGNREP